MTAHPIPDAALDDRLGFIGTAGSGKTYNAGGAVERVLARRARVVIVDPLGVWFGLRLLADGKTASPFDVAIFGGVHSDLPLIEHAGALIGETAATMAESCIVDLSQLGTKSSERRFMTAFLETIYRKASGEPFHLVVDEADLFAPQKPPKGDETLLNLMEQIVRRGRVKGFIPWLITQRPAVLNKNVLSQVDGLVAFKLTASQDRDALDGWIEGQADKVQGKAIKDSLPAMQVGQGIVWVPGRGVLATVSFPPKQTFDSSRTPKRGEKAKPAAALKPLDLGKLKERLATVEAETKASDPKALKAEIASLRRQMTEAATVAAKTGTAIDPKAIEEAEQRGYERGHAEGGEQVMRGVANLAPNLAAAVGRAEAACADAKRLLDSFSTFVEAMESERKQTPRRVALPSPQPKPKERAIRQPRINGASGLPGPEQRILNSLATWRQMDEGGPSNAQVAWLAGYSPNSTGYTNPRSALKTKGLVDYPAPGVVALTDDGEAFATAIDIEGRLLDFILSRLTGPEARILRAAADFGRAARNDEVAEQAGYSATSTGYTNPRSALKTKELITYPSSGMVAIAEWLQ